MGAREGSHGAWTMCSGPALGSGGWTARMTQWLGLRARWVDTVSYMGSGAWDKSYREEGWVRASG